MAFKFKHKKLDDAELDVTSFMNLMIVLVPVMLLSLTFTQVTVLEINLPQLTEAEGSGFDAPPQLDVLVSEKGFKVYYPSNKLIQKIPLIDGENGKAYDFTKLSKVLQEVKLQLIDKRDILIRSTSKVDYQTLVSTMDSAKSFKTVVAASLVEVELFPEISLAEANK